MRKRRQAAQFLHATALLLALAFLPARSLAGDYVAYRVSLVQSQQHLFQVRMFTTACHDGHLLFQLPAWNALYQIRDFAQYVREFRAQDSAGQPLQAEKIDKQTWAVSCRKGAKVEVTYKVFWNESSPYGSQLDQRHAFINFANILMYLRQGRQLPVTVEFSELPAGWRIGSALSFTGSPPSSPPRTYDEIVDNPVEVGTFDDWEFEVEGVTYRVIVHGDRRSYSQEKMTSTLEAIVRTETALMRETPFKLFTFIFHFLPEFASSFPFFGATGGMEHMFSTAIHLSERSMRDDPLAFASTAAHEFFHLWNVKRIRPLQLEPVDYTRENYTRALWFAEGGTTAYEMYTLLRSGLKDRKQFYADLAEKIRELEERPARQWKSVEEASLEAWLERYGEYRRSEASLSYYTKGAILTILLDLAIRDATDNQRSLDDILRYLNQEFARKGRFYDERRDLRAAVNTVAGRSLEEFFQRYVSGTDAIPYEDFFRIVGVNLRWETETRGWLGLVVFRDASGRFTVNEVEPDSPAYAAGLMQGDLLIALEGERVGRDFERKVRRLEVGRRVRLRYRRAEEEREVKLVVGGRARQAIRLEEAAKADARARRLREGWLAGRTN